VVELLTYRVLPAVAAGVLLSFVFEYALRPRPGPAWRRPWAALAVHVGLWLAVFAAVLAALRRPWFAAATVDALLIGLVLVSNAKLESLREPFVFQDYEYFTDALRHPRLYFPYLGFWRLLLALTLIIGALVAGLLVEASLVSAIGLGSFVLIVAALAALATALLVAAGRALPGATYDPVADLTRLGLLASLWRYGADEQRTPPVLTIRPEFSSRGGDSGRTRPDLIAIQSESFFDPRRSLRGVRPEVLAHFDALKASAAAHGELQVGAWGANTVRTEFAFLSGIDPQTLGVHRFNPYRRAARKPLPTIASYLKSLGYRTVCLHPYPASFYRRDLVFPGLGFDEFIDIRGFADAERAGPFVSDQAVAERICRLVRAAGRTQPLFVFAITMENHGPLHLETATPEDIERWCSSAPPRGCEDLVVYLRHLAHADLMIAALRECLAEADRPAGLCFYGDHVPILPKVYAALGSPAGTTEYLIWNNEAAGADQRAAATPTNVPVERLSLLWLQQAGLMDRTRSDPDSAATPGA
jgi:phosphoglycerol transferase MdoB-like AlkP superfamily enzyme